MPRQPAHDRRSIRLPHYDYSQPGPYFITICTQDRTFDLGRILEGSACLSDFGKDCRGTWDFLPSQFPGVRLDAFVIMPNHVHGILYGSGPYQTDRRPDPATEHLPFQDRHPRLGEIVRFFKYESTRRINLRKGKPGVHFWQRNYYEHVIRDDYDLARIRNYIANNPKRWDLDRENPGKNGDDEFDLWLDSLASSPMNAPTAPDA